MAISAKIDSRRLWATVVFGYLVRRVTCWTICIFIVGGTLLRDWTDVAIRVASDLMLM